MPASIYFDYGKEARAQGRPRELRDRRISSVHQQEWLDGWDAQDTYIKRAAQPKADPAKLSKRLGQLKALVAKIPEPQPRQIRRKIAARPRRTPSA